MTCRVRALASDDSIEAITALIHAAYAPHAAEGLRYWGTHQTVDDTARRFASGRGLIAEVDGEIVGTVTLRTPQPASIVALYREPGTWSICQFAVAPGHKARGVGTALHDRALTIARLGDARRMAIDTAAPAVALIAKYRAWGYEVCGACDWRPHTNYLSVLMSRAIDPMPSVVRHTLRAVDPRSDDALALLREAAIEARALYPEFAAEGAPWPSNPPAAPGETYVVAYEGRVPVGCGAWRRIDAAMVEVRRMYVLRTSRRTGVARKILAALENAAAAAGYKVMRLETGHRQVPAMALYESFGFERIEPFGDYANDPTSVCYEKDVAPRAGG